MKHNTQDVHGELGIAGVSVIAKWAGSDGSFWKW
jgi:hypothetical protein